MGNSLTRKAKTFDNKQPVYKGIFGKELQMMNEEIKQVLNERGTFRNKSYNVSLKSICDKYTFVIEKQLYKHIKVDLQDLNSSIYMIPKRRGDVEYENKIVTKQELCHNISDYYNRILRILHVIRSIYDLENDGNYSIAGLIMKNIKTINGGIVEINYCASNQEDASLLTTPNVVTTFVDMKQIKGLNEFVNNILSKDEAKTFVGHYKELFGNNSHKIITNMVCNDTLLNNTEYSKIYNKNFNCKDVMNKSQQQTGGNRPISLHFHIKKNNPILNWNLCVFPKKHILKEDKLLLNLIKSFKTHYQTNVNNIHKIIQDLTLYDNTTNSIELKTLTDFQLKAVENQFKKHIMTFFLQSIIDYKAILEYIKNNPNIDVSNSDLSKSNPTYI